MSDLRLELRVKNAKLWHLIFDTYPTVAAFCRANNMEQGHVGALIGFRKNPYQLGRGRWGAGKSRGLLIKIAVRLCELGGFSAEELFPPELYLNAMPKTFSAEMTSRKFLGLGAARGLLAAENPLKTYEATEARERIFEMLHTLSPREELVVINRFGLDGAAPKQDDVIGKMLGVGKDRVQQIGAKAIHKLRHPSRARMLKHYVEV